MCTLVALAYVYHLNILVCLRGILIEFARGTMQPNGISVQLDSLATSFFHGWFK
jgi:hypothetical protein